LCLKGAHLLKPSTLTPQVLEKLGFSNPLDYDIKPDGLLVVVDSTGRKYSLPRKDYEDLLDAPGPAENPPSKRGRKPKLAPKP